MADHNSQTQKESDLNKKELSDSDPQKENESSPPGNDVNNGTAQEYEMAALNEPKANIAENGDLEMGEPNHNELQTERETEPIETSNTEEYQTDETNMGEQQTDEQERETQSHNEPQMEEQTSREVEREKQLPQEHETVETAPQEQAIDSAENKQLTSHAGHDGSETLSIDVDQKNATAVGQNQIIEPITAQSDENEDDLTAMVANKPDVATEMETGTTDIDTKEDSKDDVIGYGNDVSEGDIAKDDDVNYDVTNVHANETEQEMTNIDKETEDQNAQNKHNTYEVNNVDAVDVIALTAQPDDITDSIVQLRSRMATSTDNTHLPDISAHKNPVAHFASFTSCIKPAKAEIARIPSPPTYIKEHLDKFKQTRQLSRVNYTPKLLRISTVPVKTRNKASPFPSNVYYEKPRKPNKRLTLEEALTARPPLQTDMDGPGPWSYSPRNKPLKERNAPVWSFGRRSYVEKDGGSRTSWMKTWFQGPFVWTQKVDFHSDRKWASPTTYSLRPTCGTRQHTFLSSPSHSIGVRENFCINKPGAEAEPSPNEYNRERSDTLTLRSSPAYTNRSRQGGTVLWQNNEVTPGPGSYNPSCQSNLRHHPAFTIRGIRKPNVHKLGPFASF